MTIPNYIAYFSHWMALSRVKSHHGIHFGKKLFWAQPKNEIIFVNNTIFLHIFAFLFIFGQLFILKCSRIASLLGGWSKKILFWSRLMCIKPNIFNFTLIFVQNIWGAQTYFWEMCTIQRFSAILIFMPNICGGKLKYGNTKTQLCLCRLRVETYIWDLYKTKHFQFYTDIHAKHLGGGYIFLKYHRAEPQFYFLSGTETLIYQSTMNGVVGGALEWHTSLKFQYFFLKSLLYHVW